MLNLYNYFMLFHIFIFDGNPGRDHKIPLSNNNKTSDQKYFAQ